jgi:hypothetical protein
VFDGSLAIQPAAQKHPKADGRVSSRSARQRSALEDGEEDTAVGANLETPNMQGHQTLLLAVRTKDLGTRILKEKGLIALFGTSTSSNRQIFSPTFLLNIPNAKDK